MNFVTYMKQTCGTSVEDNNYICVCRAQWTGNNCETGKCQELLILCQKTSSAHYETFKWQLLVSQWILALVQPVEWVLVLFVLETNTSWIHSVTFGRQIFIPLHSEINPCSSSPCENNGTCENTIDGIYTCVCKPQWTGINCEVGKC